MVRGQRFSAMKLGREFFCAWCKFKGIETTPRAFDNVQRRVICIQCAREAGFEKESIPKSDKAEIKTVKPSPIMDMQANIATIQEQIGHIITVLNAQHAEIEVLKANAKNQIAKINSAV